ncbi:MAG: PRC-barrel domain containing protein [Leptolyngbya sp. SIO3F4]|nr:PRC-barrel domain containing protein [Leptolyngbya sp. SIO3F4]
MSALRSHNLWVGSNVITETGISLGWVRGAIFDPENGKPIAVSITRCRLFQLPETITGSYELSVVEITMFQANLLIATAGAEKKLKQTTVGMLERLGLSKVPWEKANNHYTLPDSFPNENETDFTSTPKNPRPNPDPNHKE